MKQGGDQRQRQRREAAEKGHGSRDEEDVRTATMGDRGVPSNQAAPATVLG